MIGIVRSWFSLHLRNSTLRMQQISKRIKNTEAPSHPFAQTKKLIKAQNKTSNFEFILLRGNCQPQGGTGCCLPIETLSINTGRVLITHKLD